MTIHHVVRLLIVPCALLGMAIALPAMSAPGAGPMEPLEVAQAAAETSVTGTLTRETSEVTGGPQVKIEDGSGASYVLAGPRVGELAAMDGKTVTVHGAATRRADGAQIFVVSRYEAAKE
ncbi:MAG: hypothetical protein QNK05_06630 [Myxococcota bacterium]|nr:hypothetical protein [Myxococcota bacterium]